VERSRKGEGRRQASLGAWLAAVCVLAVPFAGCASPSPPGLGDAGASGPSAGSAPRFAASGPDAEEYGAGDGYPIGDRSTFFEIPFLVGSYSHLDQVFEGRLVRRAATPSRLERAASEPAVRYEYQGDTFTVDDYLARHPATALLIARDHTLLVERYQYARNDRHRFTSWSMAKTVTAMLVGIALAEGRIRSVDDRADA
jgi:CubicO group peptidase (beta-lactamase class C family)